MIDLSHGPFLRVLSTDNSRLLNAGRANRILNFSVRFSTTAEIGQSNHLKNMAFDPRRIRRAVGGTADRDGCPGRAARSVAGADPGLSRIDRALRSQFLGWEGMRLVRRSRHKLSWRHLKAKKWRSPKSLGRPKKMTCSGS